MKYESNSLEDTKAIAERFVENLLKTRGKDEDKACIILLRGDLGAGKTTFVKAVAEIFGIEETVTSPTFVIEKVYKIGRKIEDAGSFTHIIHIDAYRLQNGSELKTLGWDEMAKSSSNLIFLEWPERVADILPEDAIYIDFEHKNETGRVLTYSV